MSTSRQEQVEQLARREFRSKTAASRGGHLTGILKLQGVQSAIRNPPKACQGCNPPQSAIRHA
eukprot:3238047-Alexandrium_andersonii.AAC.1